MRITRRELLHGAGAAAAASLLPTSAFAVQTAGPDAEAERLFAQLVEEYLWIAPETASGLGIDTGGRARLRGLLSERGLERRVHDIGWLQSAAYRLASLPLPRLSQGNRAEAEIALTVARTALDGLAFPYGDVAIGGWRNGPYVVAQNMGSYLDVPRFLDSSHKVENAQDAEAYLSRLRQHARQLDDETAQMRDARGRGVVASDVVLDRTLAALRRTRAGEPREWLVVTSLARRAEAIPGDWAARAERIAAAEIAPALDRQLAEVEEHRRVAGSEPSVLRLPDGEAYYAWALRAATTTTRTPDEVHRQGLEELAHYQGEMDVLLRRLGFSQGSLAERMRAIEADPRYVFAEGDAGRAEIMAFIEGRIADIRPRLPRAFATLVRGIVEVRRIPPAEEMGAPGAYGGAGSIDGSIPGRFWINLHDPRSHSRVSLPSLTYHETIPGHVWQGEYTFRLPLIRSLMGDGFSAYSEGWGLYAEQLAGELGVYETEPAGRLGFLSSMAFRSARLVVDTGLHAKRWSRERALAWFSEATGDPDVSSEVDRYSVWPGQACAYKVGHSEIVRQRARAQAALGSRYDLKSFDDLVVGGGPRPLTVLARDIDRHIAERRRG
ncbi:MAG TPA: DUF885 family protein [Allosphingosinicella sp.]|nr:DUF885 family protein [Allosphingosinicella sp.]